MVLLQIWVKNMIDKKLIRKEVFKRRKAASAEDLNSWSHAIAQKVCKTDLYQNAQTIYTYVAYNREVETRIIIEQAWADGKKVAVPRVEGDVMNFYLIQSYDELEPGCMGIPEPATSIPANDEHALMIMPGVAFDRKKNRVGYGGGYYDKYLEAHPGLGKLAVAFEFQFMDEVPVEPTDICPEMIITESSIY